VEYIAMNRPLRFALLVCLSLGVNAQEARKPITNSDVISMTKAGLNEQTIVLAIEHGPATFDTSPQALVALKKAGVSDAVLNAMLTATKISPSKTTAAASGSSPDEHSPNSPNALRLIQKALLAVAPMNKLTSITATRQLLTVTQDRLGLTSTSEVELTAVYPDRVYMEVHSTNGLVRKFVLTPQVAYADDGQRRSDVPVALAEDIRTGMKFDVPYVAQNMGEFTFTYDGKETLDTEECDRIRIKHRDGKEVVWSIDHRGTIRRRIAWLSSGEVSSVYSDFRLVEGVNYAFHRRSTGGNGTIDTTVKLYRINPPRNEINSALFESPLGTR
jgi:hypothetical protein